MNIPEGFRSDIGAAVNAGFEDQTAFLQQLVRFPSTRGNEHTVQDFMARTMLDRGLVLDRFAMDPDALASHPGGGEISPAHSAAPIVVGIMAFVHLFTGNPDGSPRMGYSRLPALLHFPLCFSSLASNVWSEPPLPQVVLDQLTQHVVRTLPSSLARYCFN